MSQGLEENISDLQGIYMKMGWGWRHICHTHQLYTSTHTPMAHARGVRTLKVLQINVLIKGVLLAPRMYHLPYTSNG